MRNNEILSRFELEINGQITFATYKRKGDILTIDHVETPVVARGSGAAGKLMEEIASMAKREKLKIVPICGYASAWLRKHEEYDDLIA